MVDNRTAPYAALLMRLCLGALFLAHAGLKLFVFTPAGTAGFFASLGLPPAMGDFTIAWEVCGGLALILGLRPRIAVLAMIPDLLGAIVLVHARVGFFFTDSGGGWEYPGLWACRPACARADGRWHLGTQTHIHTLSPPGCLK